MAWSQPLRGYPQLAACMEESPGVAIFRRFGDLNIQNLLYLQSELVHMLEDYQDIALEDYESKDAEKRQFSKEWMKLSESSGEQWQKWLDIRSKLEHYSQGGPMRYNVATVFLAYMDRHRSSAYPNKPAITVHRASSTTVARFTDMACGSQRRPKLLTQRGRVHLGQQARI